MAQPTPARHKAESRPRRLGVRRDALRSRMTQFPFPCGGATAKNKITNTRLSTSHPVPPDVHISLFHRLVCRP